MEEKEERTTWPRGEKKSGGKKGADQSLGIPSSIHMKPISVRFHFAIAFLHLDRTGGGWKWPLFLKRRCEDICKQTWATLKLWKRRTDQSPALQLEHAAETCMQQSTFCIVNLSRFIFQVLTLNKSMQSEDVKK